VNKPQIFNHSVFGELPVIVLDGTEWFGATEAARALSFSDPHKAIVNHVDEEDSTVHPVLTEGGMQQKKFINESGLYSLIFGAAKQGNNPEIQEKAKQFKRWVTSEVLPAIRKTGAYALPTMSPAEILAGVANQLVEQERRLTLIESRVDRTEKQQEDIKEILSLNPIDARKKVTAILNKIAQTLGGGNSYRDVRTDSYKRLEERARCDLAKRVTNKKQRLALEGVSKSKIDKVNQLDVIFEDGRLAEIYFAVVKEMAVANRIEVEAS
jgi:prophage antirepressor-like protein